MAIDASEVLMVWRDTTTNEAFHLKPDGAIYCFGPRCEADFRPNPGGVLVEAISSIPAFMKDIQNNPNCFVEHLHPRFLPRRTRKVAPVGRKAIWLRWIDDGEPYQLKSDYTIRNADGHTIAGRLPMTTNVAQFVESLRTQGHTLTFVHQKFQKKV